MEELTVYAGDVYVFSRTTAVVRLHISCYALAQHLLCKR